MNILLGEMESRFAELIWEKSGSEGIPSGELVGLCASEFDWKKSTTYTMLKRLCDKGFFKNEGGIVKTVITKQELAAMKGEKLVNESYGGSLPRFLAAFAGRKKLSEDDLNELQQLIDEYRRG